MPSGAGLPVPRRWLELLGRKLLRFTDTLHGLGAFALITLGVTLSKLHTAGRLIRPLVATQILRSGIRLLPMAAFLAVALGLVIIGQTVLLLSRVGAQHFAGTLMVTVVVRELGPIITALLALARIGAGTVIELGTSRATGEIEVLEALGIDPVHYLVVPRVIGLALALFALTIYTILIALVSGYVFIFLQDVPMTAGDYFWQLAGALQLADFALVGLKSLAFGVIIAVITCYQGLARPLRIEDVSGATTRAVGHSMVACVVVDAVFIVMYFVI